MNDHDLIEGTAAWLARTDVSALVSELSASDTLNGAREFLKLLAKRETSPADFQLDDHAILILHIASRFMEAADPTDFEKPLELAEHLYGFIEGVTWPAPDFDEQAELLAECAFAGWRISRRLEKPAEEARWLARFGATLVSPSPLHFEVERVLALPILERIARASEIRLEDSELLLAICEVLRPQLESSPLKAKAEAEFFYSFLDKPKRKIGLFDEREYYLGEFALTAGAASRLLFHREEARRWFDSAEASFTRVANGLAQVARVAYQRLALALEERRFDEVFDLAPLWAESFRSISLGDDALKCHFLEGVAFREIGRFAESVQVFRFILNEANRRGNSRLSAHAATTLAQYLRLLGKFDEALDYAQKALPLLKQLDMRTALVKLQWSVGNILREQNKLGEALAAYREALDETQAIGMRADVAALHLVLADVMLDLGLDRQAEWEVRAALPIIDEERMVPEGFAALDLLRQALRHRQIDRKALRELHGYFGDSTG